MKRFAYLRDPAFLVALAAYSLNQFWLKRVSASPFLHAHFNDLLLMPAALPPVLWLHRQLGWRRHDEPPRWAEMFGHLAIWSLICEVVGPHWLKLGTSDPLDVLAYTVGGVTACWWWSGFFRVVPHAPGRPVTPRPLPGRGFRKGLQ